MEIASESFICLFRVNKILLFLLGSPSSLYSARGLFCRLDNNLFPFKFSCYNVFVSEISLYLKWVLLTEN